MAADISAGAASAALAAPPDPLGFMDRLSEHVYLYRAPKQADRAPTLPSKAPPKLVILLSWMDARPLHIAKYLTSYRDGQVFAGSPSSSAAPAAILLVRSRRDIVFNEAKGAHAAQAAVQAIRDILGPLDGGSKGSAGAATSATSAAADPEVLVHVFSNGGCIMLAHLYDALDATHRVCLPAHVTLFDSCPGLFHYSSSVAAFSAGLERKSLLRRLVAPPIIHFFVSVFWLRKRLSAWSWRVSMWWAQWKRRRVSSPPASEASAPVASSDIVLRLAWMPHNDHSSSGGNRLEARRAYFYSDDDRLIYTADVEAHAAEATNNGFNVARLEKFTDSAHVAHVRADGPRYWRVVRQMWEGEP